MFVFPEEDDDESVLLRSVARFQGNPPVEGGLPREMLRAFGGLVRRHGAGCGKGLDRCAGVCHIGRAQ
jgi:hypothetical protein